MKGKKPGCTHGSLPPGWDAEYDVIVIGSGFAGLAAALEARRQCRSVIVLEKMRVPGGNSAISGGLIAAAGSELQEKSGIEDSPELMLADMLTAGMGYNHAELARIVAEHSLETLQWTIEELGVRYKPMLSHLGGHSVPRTYNTENTSGSGIIRPMLARCRETGIEIRLKTFLVHLVMNEASEAEGVEVREGYIFPNAETGATRRIRARKAVVLATGGYGQDKEFRAIQNPCLTDQIESTNQPGATAESLIEAIRIGATPMQLSLIQLGPWASRDEEGFGVGSMFSMLAGFPYGILVERNSGRRFVNELSDRKLLVDAMVNSGRDAVAIVDSRGVRYASTLDKCLKRGVVKPFDSIEELALDGQIPLDALQKTIGSYNRSVEKGIDEDFGKPLPADLSPIRFPPYYSIRLISKVHHCMGGIQINAKAQVMHAMTRKPIGRLYAAGEITGGVHGASRLGSNAITDCLVFGRIAGRHAGLESSRA
jgi:flavocytochrome c